VDPLERVRLQAEVAKQRVRIAKDELKRARKRLKEAKREARNARKLASSSRKEWKRARRRAKRNDSIVIAQTAARAVPDKETMSTGRPKRSRGVPRRASGSATAAVRRKRRRTQR